MTKGRLLASKGILFTLKQHIKPFGISKKISEFSLKETDEEHIFNSPLKTEHLHSKLNLRSDKARGNISISFFPTQAFLLS